MAGRGAGGFGSIQQFVVAGVVGYFRVVLHLRLSKFSEREEARGIPSEDGSFEGDFPHINRNPRATEKKEGSGRWGLTP